MVIWLRWGVSIVLAAVCLSVVAFNVWVFYADARERRRWNRGGDMRAVPSPGFLVIGVTGVAALAVCPLPESELKLSLYALALILEPAFGLWIVRETALTLSSGTGSAGRRVRSWLRGYDDSPLHEAARAEQASKISRLLKAGWRVDVPNSRNQTPLHLAASQGESATRRMLDAGANPNRRDIRGETPLHVAAVRDQAKAVAALLAAGANPDLAPRGGHPPLWTAASAGRREAVEALLEAGVNPNRLYRWSPLHWAASNGHGDVVRVLLAHGADPAIEDHRGRTPLDQAKGSEVVAALLEAGVDPDRQYGGYTPLHNAAALDDAAMVETLLAHGADPNMRDDRGRTPALIAEAGGHTELAARLAETE